MFMNLDFSIRYSQGFGLVGRLCDHFRLGELKTALSYDKPLAGLWFSSWPVD